MKQSFTLRGTPMSMELISDLGFFFIHFGSIQLRLEETDGPGLFRGLDREVERAYF